MYTALQQPPAQRAVPQPPPQQYGYQPQPQYQQPPAPAGPQMPRDEDFLTAPAQATRQLMEVLKANEFQPAMAQQTQVLGQLVKENVRLRNPDVFQRYGPEVELTLQQYAPDPRAWTPDNVQAVVDVVRGRHAHEVAEAEIERRVAERLRGDLNGASIRPDGSGAPSASAPNQLDLNKLPPMYAETLQRLKMNPQVIDEFLMATKVRHEGLTLEQARERWLQSAQQGDIITDGVNQNIYESVPANEKQPPPPAITMRSLGYRQKESF